MTEIAGGSQHVLALLANGQVYAWGADGVGQLGFETGSEATESCGRQKCSMVPQPVGELNHVVAVAAARRRRQLRRSKKKKTPAR